MKLQESSSKKLWENRTFAVHNRNAAMRYEISYMYRDISHSCWKLTELFSAKKTWPDLQERHPFDTSAHKKAYIHMGVVEDKVHVLRLSFEK